MNRMWKIATVVGIGATATALCTAQASASPSHSAGSASHRLVAHSAGAHRVIEHGVVFVQNNNLSANMIVAYRRDAGGGLTQVGTYPTGGKGGQANGSAADFLASEGSLTYDKSSHVLYAVNAGSNTITSFAVDGAHLRLIQVIGSGGQFPVSVAARGPMVFVLNGRAGGSVSGYLSVGGHLLAIPAWHRELHSNTPVDATEFVSTPGQIGFTPDGSKLVVTTKNGANTVDVFPIGFSGPSQQPVVTSLPGAVPFGFSFDARGRLVLTEAGTNSVATFSVAGNGVLTQIDSEPTGQLATCWVINSDGTFYVSNAASGTLSLFTSARGVLTDHGTAATDAGTIDAAASSDGRYLYVQAGGAGVLDIFHINWDGTLSANGSVPVPGAPGQEGVVAL
jgi:6-phosphogluconolactonase (cycloisomerase 2 family)